MSAPGDPRAFKLRNVAVAGRELALAWGDGHESYLPFEELRRECPCATCTSRAARAPSGSGDPLRVLSGPRLEEITIARLVPVGAYAVQIVWSDGHDTGIYAFELLRRMCRCAECAPGGRVPP